MIRRRVWIPEAPMVNLRRYREIGAIGLGIGVEGYFDVELVHARTGLVKRKLRFRNLITDAGMDNLGFGTSPSKACLYLAVGTGSAVPSEGDTELAAEAGRTSSDGGFSDEEGSVGTGDLLEYWWYRRTRVFATSEANGNLAELGFFDESSGGTLWNRQLFRDELGNPTTITKTAEDQLRVRYEFRVYPPMADVHQEVSVNGSPVAVVQRPFGVAASSSNGWRGAFTGMGSMSAATHNIVLFADDTLVARGSTSSRGGTTATADAQSSMSYVPGSFYQEREMRWNPSSANFGGGIGRLMLHWWRQYTGTTMWGLFQCNFNPKIVKSDTERLIIQSRVTFSRLEV